MHACCCRQVQGMSAATAEATSALLALWPPELAWELYVASSAAHELCHLAQHCPSALFATVLSHIAGRLMACLPEVGGRPLLPQTGMRAAIGGKCLSTTPASMSCLLEHLPLPCLTPMSFLVAAGGRAWRRRVCCAADGSSRAVATHGSPAPGPRLGSATAACFAGPANHHGA